jgi:hypothetical protein
MRRRSMRTAGKIHTPSDWQFTMQHLGRELRKLDPPDGLPPRLRALFHDLESKWAIAMHRNREQENKGDLD